MNEHIINGLRTCTLQICLSQWSLSNIFASK
jgi:hypothetical protein